MKLNLGVVDAAKALASYSAARQSIVARNVANADTPGYRAQDLPKFSEVYSGGAGARDPMKVTRSGHFIGQNDGKGPEPVHLASFGSASPNGNTVSLEDQMVRSAQTQTQHDLAIGVYKKTMDILRTSLGRK